MAVRAANLGHRDHLATFVRVDRAWVRTVHYQRQMRAKTVVVGHVLGERPLEMPCIQHDDVIQTFAAETANEPFDVGLLPRAPRGNDDFFDAHVVDPLAKWCIIDAIAIPQQIARCLIPGKGLNHLLRRPLRRGGAVTLTCTIRRRPWARISRTNSTFWGSGGTTKQSRDTRSCTWLFKKVFHVGDGGLCGRTRYCPMDGVIGHLITITYEEQETHIGQ
jgi:hypothetical protein